MAVKSSTLKHRARRLGTSAALICALTGGATLAGTSDASAAPVSRAAVRCGLTKDVSNVNIKGFGFKIVYYQIRNCHSYYVWRKLEVAGDTDGPCLKLAPGQTRGGTHIIAGTAIPRDIKPC